MESLRVQRNESNEFKKTRPLYIDLMHNTPWSVYDVKVGTKKFQVFNLTRLPHYAAHLLWSFMTLINHRAI